MAIVKHLLKEGYCFAVMQSYSWLTKGKMLQNQEWELIAAKSDYKTLKKEGFELLNNPADRLDDRNPEGMVSRVLNREEIAEFLAMKDEFFSKVLETEDGIIWEIRERSLTGLLKKIDN